MWNKEDLTERRNNIKQNNMSNEQEYG